VAAGLVLYSGRDAPYTWFLLRGSGDPMRDYVLTLLVTAAVTYMLTPLVRRLARRIGAIKEPRDRDVHVAPIPLLGGVAMYGGLVAGILVADQIPQLRDGFANTGMVSGLLLAGGLLVVVGIIDDRWGMSPLMKAAGQVAAGGILVATGTQLNWLPLPGGNTYVPTSDQATVLTILIVVATINAVNFIDGLDGLAAGIVAIAAVSFFLYYYSMTKVIDISSLAAPALASAILIGMCLGFLPHNFSPASIFMGDTGSMLLGLLLAYAPISSIPSLDPAVLSSHINRYPEIMPLLLPAALLVIPYADLLLAVVRRTRAGQSPFAPDRKHLHHRLLDIGHSQRASVLIMYLWAALFSGSVVWLSLQRTQQRGGANHHGHPVIVFIAITAAAVVALLLMSMPKLRWWGRGARPDEQPAQLGESPSKLTAVPVPVGLAAALEPAGLEAAGLEAAGLEAAGLEAAGLESPRLESAGLEPAALGLAQPAAAELRPPAAAPVAATGSAEPQLVAAGAVSRMTPLAAPAPNGASLGRVAPAVDWRNSERAEASEAERFGTARDWADRGWGDPEWAGQDWASSHWGGRNQAQSGWPGRGGIMAGDPAATATGPGAPVGDPPGPGQASPGAGSTEPDAGQAGPTASEWKFGDRRRAPSENGTPDPPRRSGTYLPAHGAPNGIAAPANGTPETANGSAEGNGAAAVRSIIGTPPPAVTSLGADGATDSSDGHESDRRQDDNSR
jgi:UDP-GlcNAc:undecaprenyl-phosphate/decaprenyl-phosphate GlcNAc-1-phosphate transferase